SITEAILAPHQTPTLIDCLLLKNCVRYCLAALAESFCSSAAEKRDYAAFRLTRQPLTCFVAPSFPTHFIRCKTGREL
ncbi:hypothetical protein, partial [Massilia rhizosphaerae]|uniref:hypothetical protein n=1 Tax=Massilia rhizosphaerae TaxID=2784389 RepID=UPI001E46B176